MNYEPILKRWNSTSLAISFGASVALVLVAPLMAAATGTPPADRTFGHQSN
jgi:hypothetical protein